MPYEVKWHVQDQIIFVRCYGHYTLDELMTMSNDILMRLAATDTQLHVIADVSAMEKYPTQVVGINNATYGWLNHNQMGWLIVIGVHNPMLGFLIQVVTQVIGTKVRQVKSVEDAMTVLQKVDRSLVHS